MRMRSLVFAAGCAVLGAGLPARAPAEVTTFAEAGRWEAFGGTANDGKPVCGVGVRDDAGGQAVVLKWFIGDPFLTIQVLKRSWSMAQHSTMPVSLQIDGYPVWSATAFGSGSAVEWVLTNDSIDEFENEFRKGSSLKLQFRRGKDTAWAASLAGSQAIVHSMVACMKKLKGA